MTYEEAKAILEENAPIGFPPKFTWDEWCEAKAMAAEALERQEKYKWHDLRVDMCGIDRCDVCWGRLFEEE